MHHKLGAILIIFLFLGTVGAPVFAGDRSYTTFSEAKNLTPVQHNPYTTQAGNPSAMMGGMPPAAQMGMGQGAMPSLANMTPEQRQLMMVQMGPQIEMLKQQIRASSPLSDAQIDSIINGVMSGQLTPQAMQNSQAMKQFIPQMAAPVSMQAPNNPQQNMQSPYYQQAYLIDLGTATANFLQWEGWDFAQEHAANWASAAAESAAEWAVFAAHQIWARLEEVFFTQQETAREVGIAREGYNVAALQKIGEIMGDDVVANIEAERKAAEAEAEIEDPLAFIAGSESFGRACEKKSASKHMASAIVGTEAREAAINTTDVIMGSYIITSPFADIEPEAGGGDGPMSTAELEEITPEAGGDDETLLEQGLSGQALENRMEYHIIAMFCDPIGEDSPYSIFCPEKCDGSGGDPLCKGVSEYYPNGPDADGVNIIKTINANKAAGDPDFKKSRGIYGLDVNYGLAMGSRRTFGLGHYWYQDGDGFQVDFPRSRGGDQYIADSFFNNIFNDQVTIPSAETVESKMQNGMPQADIGQWLRQQNEFAALKSIAKYSRAVAMARKEPVPYDGESETLMDKASEILLGQDAEITLPDNYPENWVEEFTPDEDRGLAPSLEAQIEFLGKLVYMNPKFLADAGDATEQSLLTAQAIRNVMTHELMETTQRSEMLMAAIVQIMLQDKYDKIEDMNGASY